MENGRGGQGIGRAGGRGAGRGRGGLGARAGGGGLQGGFSSPSPCSF